MSATSYMCKTCNGGGTVRDGGSRGAERACSNCGGTGHIPFTQTATVAEPASRFAEYADALVSEWPPLSPAKIADLRRIVVRSLAPAGFEIHHGEAA